jgi:DNA-binding NarL/FixJ family response regulator
MTSLSRPPRRDTSGSTNAGIAARLVISEATVKTHLVRIYTKLGVGDRC